MATTTHPGGTAHPTPDSHDFPTRHYDLVKEFVIALRGDGAADRRARGGVLLTGREGDHDAGLGQRRRPPTSWPPRHGELAGTTTSATYGAPYNHASDGQKVLGIPLQKWGGVRIPVNSQDLVLQPLSDAVVSSVVTQALAQWRAASPTQQTAWATAYGDALAAAPNGDPTQVARATTGRCRSCP